MRPVKLLIYEPCLVNENPSRRHNSNVCSNPGGREKKNESMWENSNYFIENYLITNRERIVVVITFYMWFKSIETST